MHSKDRFTVGYPVTVHRDPEVYRQLNLTNKNLARSGFCLGAIVVGGYFVIKKVRELSDRVRTLEKEMNKETR